MATRTCPICGKSYSEVPAISRRDGAMICADCGTREALADTFGLDKEAQNHILQLVHRREAEDAGKENKPK